MTTQWYFELLVDQNYVQHVYLCHGWWRGSLRPLYSKNALSLVIEV